MDHRQTCRLDRMARIDRRKTVLLVTHGTRDSLGGDR